MLMLALLSMPAWAHTAAVVIAFVCAAAIVYWFVRAVKLPEPFNYVVYAAVAIGALFALVWLVGQVG
jgi:hypothetical protein